MDVVYFDLETQRTANDVGGWDRKHEMGMSIGVTYSTARGEYKIYGESGAEDLVDQLRRADLVVGYNLISFDYEVLRKYSTWELKDLVPTLDLMVEIEKVLGHRLKLDSLATASLGVSKIAEGLDAIKWWREGKILEIAEYCCYDVKVTWMLHEFGMREGEVFYDDKFGRRQRVAVDWKNPDSKGEA